MADTIAWLVEAEFLRKQNVTLKSILKSLSEYCNGIKVSGYEHKHISKEDLLTYLLKDATLVLNDKEPKYRKDKDESKSVKMS